MIDLCLKHKQQITKRLQNNSNLKADRHVGSLAQTLKSLACLEFWFIDSPNPNTIGGEQLTVHMVLQGITLNV